MSKWIEFKKDSRPANKKTDKYHIFNKEYRTFLGEIKWYAPFRKYSFFPEPNMVFEATCTQDITDFMNNLMEERKKSKTMKILLASLLILIAVSSFAQAKKDTTHAHVYKKYIPLDIQDFNAFTEALNQWKRLSMYDPQTAPEQKVQTYKDIEAYISTLMQKIKVDSVQVKSVPKKK